MTDRKSIPHDSDTVPKIPPEQIELFDRWFDECARSVGLTEWSFRSVLAPRKADAPISIQMQYGSAIVRPARMFFSLTPEAQREGVAHELVHVFFHPVDQLVDTLEEIVGKKTARLLRALFSDAEELLCTRLETVIAKTLPMPPNNLQSGGASFKPSKDSTQKQSTA